MADFAFDASLESDLYDTVEGPVPSAPPAPLAEQLMQLLALDVPERAAQRVFAMYKDEGLARIHENPWLLAHVFNLQWRQADTVARKLGRAKTDPQRLGSAMFTELLAASRNGHCFEHVHTITQAAAARTGVKQADVKAVLDDNTHKYPIEVDGPRLWLRWLYLDELHIERCVKALVAHTRSLRGVEHWDALATQHPELDADQRRAVETMLAAPISVITGGPGVGKTTIQKIVLELLPRSERVALCAPTGKASRRMSEVTQREAMTIHRLLGFNPAFGFEFSDHRPLPADLVICDEASMLDVRLASRLLRAVDPRTTRIVFVGDVNQLPPVGPGAFLKDLIASNSVPVVRLEKLYRQAETSWICRSAPKILAAKPIDLTDVADFEYWDVTDIDSAHAVGDTLVDLVRKIRDEGRDWKDFVVLTPMRKQNAPLATSHLNPLLQSAFNGQPADSLPLGADKLKVGDRVIQIHNDYELEILNGDIGTVKQISTARRGEQGALIDFDGRQVVYPFGSFRNLQLAYALTIHKSQGSEWPAVVVVCHSAHNFMLTRKLLYTAVTRAREKLYLVGDEKGVQRALNVVKDDARKTALKARLEIRT